STSSARRRRRSTSSCGSTCRPASTSRSSSDGRFNRTRARWGNLPVPPDPFHRSALRTKPFCTREQSLMAKGILGRKLGMTQVFDPETGGVTSVTVIAAGPCPVVQVKTVATDGYDAVQLAFDAVDERKLNKPELGHLGRYGVAPHRRLVEFRGEIDGAV